MPAARQAARRSKPEPALQLHAAGQGRDEAAARDAALRLGRGKRRRQDHRIGMHAGRIVIVVEVERMRCGAIGKGRGGRRCSPFADQGGTGACAFPARELPVERRDAFSQGGRANHAQGVKHEQLDAMRNLVGQPRKFPVLESRANRPAVTVGQLQPFRRTLCRGFGHGRLSRRWFGAKVQ